MHPKPALICLSVALVARAQAPWSGLAPEAVVASAPSAEDIRSKAAQVYATCSSYQDTGTVETTYTGGKAPWTERLQFSTAFSRPDRFRYAYRKGQPGPLETRYIISREGDLVRNWWTVNGKEERPESLEAALKEATGVSERSAYTVPTLLIADELEEAGTRQSLQGTDRIPDRALDGVPCFRLQRMTVKKTQDQAAKAPPQAPAYESRKVYWIDQRTFLILRVEVWTDFGDMRTFQVTRYDAKVNQPVPEAAFAFGAPH